MLREIKKAIRSQLIQVSPYVYSETADETAPMPHQVFTLSSAIYNAGQYKSFLDVDIWHRAESAGTVDELADQVADKLNNFRYLGSDVEFVIYLANIVPAPSEDETLRRKTVTFELQFRRIK